MLQSGLEWLIIRYVPLNACISPPPSFSLAWRKQLTDSSFTRDAKAVLEREHALRLLRAVMMLPPRPAGQDQRRRFSTSRSHSRTSVLSPRRADQLPPDSEGDNGWDILLEKRVALTGGMIRSLVAVAENPDDALRTVCMETLIEIGE